MLIGIPVWSHTFIIDYNHNYDESLASQKCFDFNRFAQNRAISFTLKYLVYLTV